MNQRIKAIVEEARKLTPEEQDELLDLLQIELHGEAGEGTPEEIEAAWLEVAQQRMDAADRGEATFIPAADVMAELRARLRNP